VEEGSASIIRVTRIGELGTTLAVTSKWHYVYYTIIATHAHCEEILCILNYTIEFLRSACRLLVMANVVHNRVLSPWWWRRYVPPTRRFLQEPHCVTSQKTPFFIVTAVKTSNLAHFCLIIVFIV
jgi:hypothetical protein